MSTQTETPDQVFFILYLIYFIFILQWKEDILQFNVNWYFGLWINHKKTVDFSEVLQNRNDRMCFCFSFFFESWKLVLCEFFCWPLLISISFVDPKAKWAGGTVPVNSHKCWWRILEPTKHLASNFNNIPFQSIRDVTYSFFLFFPISSEKYYCIFIGKAKYNCNINP